MVNIVLPIAGRGSRFRQAGFALPKPLIPVHGRPMIEVVVENIRPTVSHRFTFVALEEHLDKLGLRCVLERIAPGCNIVAISGVTEGAACTVLCARNQINNDDPVMIANSDQWVRADMDESLSVMTREHADGLIMTMWADHPKWSYARLNAKGQVVEVVEKQVVSHHATVGIYNFRVGRDFVRAAERMIEQNIRVNNEFYVAPVYNQIIAEGANVLTFNLGRVGDGMWGLGTPEDTPLRNNVHGR